MGGYLEGDGGGINGLSFRRTCVCLVLEQNIIPFLQGVDKRP